MSETPEPVAGSVWLALDGTPVGKPSVQAVAHKKAGKHLRKAQRKERALLERFPPAAPRFDAAEGLALDRATRDLEAGVDRHLEDWLRPMSQNLNHARLVAAQGASALIAINCLMLPLAALAVLRGPDAGRLWWALVPLCLTNLSSLLFASLAALASSVTMLDELCALPEEQYQQAVTSITQDKAHLHRCLRRELYLVGGALERQARYLRTAHRVLLGGIPLSILMLGASLALGARR